MAGTYRLHSIAHTGSSSESLGGAHGEVDVRVREGRFQKWLALAAGLSSALSGLEVSYMHYRGSYSRRVMYTPVIMSAALFGAGIVGFSQPAGGANRAAGGFGIDAC